MRRKIFLHVSFYLISVLIPTGLSAQMPRRAGNQPAVIGWTDDTHYLFRTFDQDKKPVTLKVDVKTGKSNVVLPLSSERELLVQALPSGTVLTQSDAISDDMNSVALLRDNDLYYFTKGEKDLRRLTNDNIPEVNARFSPDATKLAYTKNKDLYVYDLNSGKEIRLTFDASEKVYNGYASWVYMEEVLGRSSRYAAFWWSPDGSKLAYLRTDETDVPVFTITRLDESDGLHGTLEVTPYPYAGDPNPKVKMGIADIATAKTTWVKTDYSVDQYIAWPFWTPDSKKLAIQVINRDQNDLQIILADPLTGDYNQIYDEKNKTWVEFIEDTYVMKNGSGYLIRSSKSGFDNIYYLAWDGSPIKQLTNLDFSVTDILRVDEERKTIYFKASGPESTGSHCFRVSLDGRNLIQLTHVEGTHTVNISPKGSYYTDSWNSISSPGSILTYDKSGRQLREIYRFDHPAEGASGYAKSEMVRIPTSDGLFNMPAIITYPLNFDPSKKYPVVFTIYGGPGSKNVYDRWQETYPSWYAQNGIIQFTVDHRGSGQFGRRGLDYLYRNLGKWEILDYEDAVKWLRTKLFVDPSRMGITGSSYGGYMTCLALTKGADYWTHGFAGSSVTDFRLYDDIYTERYMDTPQDNPEGYKEGSTLNFVNNYKGKLYLSHGDADDNVHMQNSIYLISKLEDAGKRFEFMLYPGGRHGWGGLKALYYRNEANDFWLRSFFGNKE